MDYLLWFDPSDVPVADRVQRAANYYESKYGKRPTRCLLPKDEAGLGPTDLTCVRDPLVLPGHLWIGAE